MSFVCVLVSFCVVPVLDRILQPSTTVVLGPVWVTRGAERFSPKGAFNFFATLLLNTKDRIKQSKAYKEQVLQTQDQLGQTNKQTNKQRHTLS